MGHLQRGCQCPEEYGDYFAWGETQPKTSYDWSTYKYANGARDKLTKYCDRSKFGNNGFTDIPLNTLQSGDDAATANWGSGWRTPSVDQWWELLRNTTHQWTTQNGVNGWLFTASNGKSLFLPAAGYRWDGGLYDAGSHGYYWSRSLDTDYRPYIASYLYFYSGDCRMYYYSRYLGFSVRPVREN